MPSKPAVVDLLDAIVDYAFPVGEAAQAALSEIDRLNAIVNRLPGLAKRIYEEREYNPCWYNSDGDCGNWPECGDDCPLKQLGVLAGLTPQEDGGIDKQAEAASKQAKEGD